MRDLRTAERERFAHYARTLADRMHLRDWTIGISEHLPRDPDDIATVSCCEGKRHATIRLSVEFLESSPEEQRQYLCHELIHSHFAPAALIAEGQLNEGCRTAFTLMLEYGIDAVAEAWAPHLPLPDDQAKPTEGGP